MTPWANIAARVPPPDSASPIESGAPPLGSAEKSFFSDANIVWEIGRNSVTPEARVGFPCAHCSCTYFEEQLADNTTKVKHVVRESALPNCFDLIIVTLPRMQ
ncbi:hypothetical protein D9M71_637630 [compost metagenome]